MVPRLGSDPVTRRRATALLGAVLALLVPSAARADGNPASDVLIFRDAYVPYFPQPSEAEVDTLNRLLAQLREKGRPMKVAVIGTRGDLGANPDLFGRPADYAALLESEIAFRVRDPRLVVVMPDGLAGRNLGAGDAALTEIDVDTGDATDGLVRTAIGAVAAVASATGPAIALPEIAADPKPERDGGRSFLALYLASGLLVALGLALIAVALRLRAPRSPA